MGTSRTTDDQIELAASSHSIRVPDGCAVARSWTGSSPTLIRSDRQGGEDPALPILIDQTFRRFGVLHRAVGLRAQGDERVERDPGHVAFAAEPRDDVPDRTQLRVIEEDGRVGINHGDEQSRGHRSQHLGKVDIGRATNDGCMTGARHIDGSGEALQCPDLGWGAGREPRSLLRVVQIERVEVDADSMSDGRRRWQARPKRSLQLAVDVDGGVRRPPATSIAHREAVAVEIEAEPRSRPHVHQRQLPLGLAPRQHAQGQRYLRATGHLVHLVDALALEIGQLVTMLEAERPVAAGEVMVERWLVAPGCREIGGEGLRRDAASPPGAPMPRRAGAGDARAESSAARANSSASSARHRKSDAVSCHVGDASGPDQPWATCDASSRIRVIRRLSGIRKGSSPRVPVRPK